ncbi:MAG: hypothetical protein IJL43_03975, partial [Lachnospiraceae bacterium]|nr:hypothetical protein [Lachnospiraceae bacterium]
METVASQGLSVLFFLFIGFFTIVLPAAVTVLEIVFLAGAIRKKDWAWAPVIDIIGIFTAVFGMLLLLDLANVKSYEWNQEIGTQFFYTPVAKEHAPTVISFAVLSVVSPLFLNLLKKKGLPPLLFVLLIAFMYIGFAMDA